MKCELSESKNIKPIVDCAHLLDVLPSTNSFEHKEKGNQIKNPKAKIVNLTFSLPKNGLSNLL